MSRMSVSAALEQEGEGREGKNHRGRAVEGVRNLSI